MGEYPTGSLCQILLCLSSHIKWGCLFFPDPWHCVHLHSCAGIPEGSTDHQHREWLSQRKLTSHQTCTYFTAERFSPSAGRREIALLHPGLDGIFKKKIKPFLLLCPFYCTDTHSLATAIPVPGALPAESLALLPSPSCPSQKSSPRCCGCSLCFCSPPVLLVEAEVGPLQAHRASLRTSSQRHPTKEEEKLVRKGASASKTTLWPFKHTRHPTMGQGLVALDELLYK